MDSIRNKRRFASPLRYPGGKGKIANFIKLVILDNDFIGYEYVEPYAGGAGVALTLLFEEYVSHIHINDIDRGVFTFWNAVLYSTDDLCRRIRNTKVSVEEWHRQKLIQSEIEPDPIDLAFSTFFLNRTNKSGIISGGIIGGINQTGKWKIDARFNAEELVRRVEKIARYKTRISLTNYDASHYIQNYLSQLHIQSFVFIDPPYYKKGGDLYENFYNHDDHCQIAHLVQSIRQPWLVSYDAVPEIIALYQDYRWETYYLSYSASQNYKGSEIMVFGPNVQRPDVPSPANIYARAVDQYKTA